jgi:hypothetical protein
VLCMPQVWALCRSVSYKNKKQTTNSTVVEEFSTKFDKECSLVVCLSMRTTHSNMWYIDNHASLHIIGVRENLTFLTQIGDVEVVLGDDWMVKEVGCGTVSFQRDSFPPMLLRQVLYVPSLKKNLV